MKRLILAIVLLAVAGAVAGYGLWIQFDILGRVESSVADIRRAYLSGERTKCAEMANAFAEKAPDILAPFEIFLHHNKCYELVDVVSTLPASLAADENGSFLVELDRCQSRIDHLKHAEIPSIGNIF